MSHPNDHLPEAAVAVVGLACRFPGAEDADAFWGILRDGVETISFFSDAEAEPSLLDPATREHPDRVLASPVLDGADLFDASFFGYSPKEAELMDPQQRLFLECAWQALEDAGCDPRRLQRDHGGRVGVFAGASTNTYVFNLLARRDALGGGDSFQVGLGNDLAFLANRLSYKLDLRGPSLAVHTACSTALVAVHLARQSLLLDECELALAGAASVRVPQKAGYVHHAGSILSPDGHTRPFDAKAAGTLFGSGVGVVALKRLEDAVADGDAIHAVIRGSAINNDGADKASFTAPGVAGQSEVILEALAEADLDPATISYVEAHGTGTHLGDPIEVRALTKAWRRHTAERGYCALGSVKGNLGHLDSAAGMPGLIKTLLMLRHGEMPPSLGFAEPNPQIDFDGSPFYVNAELRAWQSDGPRRAAISSMGVGGTNAHLVLEEAPLAAPPRAAAPWQLLTLSARSENALANAAGRLAGHLRRQGRQDREERPSDGSDGAILAGTAAMLQLGRQAFSHRLAIVARDVDDALAKLEPITQPDGGALDTAWSALGTVESIGREITFLFPGVSSQHAGMARRLWESEPVFRSSLERSCARLESELELDPRRLLFPADGELAAAQAQLEQPRVAMPVLFALEVALAELWRHWGVAPAAMLGHSLGEYAAAHLAGVFSLDEALGLVALRGRLMPPGAMLSVPLAKDTLREIFAAELADGAPIASALDLAAINGHAASGNPSCVVSGSDEAIDAAAARLEGREVESRRLRIDFPGHSRLLDPVLERFGEAVAALRLRPPQVPWISNLTGTWITPEEATHPDYWVRQLRQPVRFADGLATLLEEPTRLLLEVGPGRALTTFLQHLEAAEGRAVASLPHPDDPRSDRGRFFLALGELWCAGAEVTWPRAENDGTPRRRERLPTYPFEHRSFWIAPDEGASLDASLPGAVGATAGSGAGPPVAISSGPSGKLVDVGRWFHLPSFRATAPPPPATPAEVPGPVLVVPDADGLGEHLAKVLEAGGCQVTVASRSATSDWRELFAEMHGNGTAPRSIVHLASATTEPPASGPDHFAAAQDTGYLGVLRLAKALAAALDEGQLEGPLRFLTVASHLLDVAGEGASPERAPVLGVTRVVPQEREEISCLTIDPGPLSPESTEPLARRLVDELAARPGESPDEPLVAYRGARRLARAYDAVRLPETDGVSPGVARALRDGGVYLVTGGLGGVGRLIGRVLAVERRAKLVLTGRSSFPPRERWAELAAGPEGERQADTARELLDWEEAGAEVLVAQADAADAEAMRAAFAAAEERFGALHGVFHTAGVTSGDSLYRAFTEMGRAESEEQFGPKVHGTYVLDALLAERRAAGHEVDLCVLFSSNAAVLGGLGYVTYSAANNFLDAFANERARQGLPWVSADWDAWPEETRKYTDVQTSMDRYTMSIEESRDAFLRATCQAPTGQVVVAVGDLEQRLAIWVRRGATEEDEAVVASAPAHPRPSLATGYTAPRDATEATIAEIWQDLLGVEQVGARDNFFDLGGHSLLATRLVSRLKEAFDAEVSLGSFFQDPTVEACSRLVGAGSKAGLGAEDTEDAEKAEILALLGELSDDEAAEMISAATEG